MYELALARALPKGGDDFQRLRDGSVEGLGHLSPRLREVIQMAMHPDPLQRPTPAQLLEEATSCARECLDRRGPAGLAQELSAVRKHVQQLEAALAHHVTGAGEMAESESQSQEF